MSETKLATKADLKEMYDRMLPYLGGSADAGFTPVGTVISVMSNHAPANYLICDGTVYNIADYPELANHFLNEFGSKNKFGGNGTTTFAVPNLSGEFLRMTGTNSHANQGSGAAVGTHQDATAIPNMRTYRNGTSGNIGGFSNNDKSSCVVQNADFMSSTTNSVIYYDNAKQNSGERKADNYTTRPTNTSVLYCIATKNFYIDPTLDYSTDEKIVGTWIDSKPIYQKTIQTTVPTTTESGTVAAVDLDTGTTIETVISYNGMLSVSDSTTVYWTKMPTVDIGKTLNGLAITLTNNNSAQSNRKNKLLLRNYYTAWNGATLYVTLQYTKPSN